MMGLLSSYTITLGILSVSLLAVSVSAATYNTCKGAGFNRYCTNVLSTTCCHSGLYASASCCAPKPIYARCTNTNMKKYLQPYSTTTCYTASKSYCCHLGRSSSSCCSAFWYSYYSSKESVPSAGMAGGADSSLRQASDTSTTMGYIIGGIIGGIVFLILIIVIPLAVCGACAATGSTRYNRSRHVVVHTNQVAPPPAQQQYNQPQPPQRSGPPPPYSQGQGYNQGPPQQAMYPPPQYPPPQQQDPAYPPN